MTRQSSRCLPDVDLEALEDFEEVELSRRALLLEEEERGDLDEALVVEALLALYALEDEEALVGQLGNLMSLPGRSWRRWS